MKKIVITLLTACFLVSTGFAEESSKEEIKFRTPTADTAALSATGCSLQTLNRTTATATVPRCV